MSGFVVWFTGLSGAGKSTLGAMLAAELRHRGVPVEVLDGDEVRNHLSRGLGFSREDRDVNVRRIGFVAKLVARSGGCAITAAISPYRAVRDEQRGPGQHGQADPHGGQGAPVTEDSQPGRARRHVQVTAAEARLPLPGTDFQPGVDEEDGQPRRHHPAVPAPGPLPGRVRVGFGGLFGPGGRRTEALPLPLLPVQVNV